MNLAAAIRATPAMPCRPWPRHVVSSERWVALAQEAGLALLALWGEAQGVHALWRDETGILAVSLPVTEARYPALSPWRAGATLFERAIADLWGHAAAGAVDARPWLDHGRWQVAAPLSPRPPPRPGAAETVAFPAAEGLDQIAIGPLAGGIAEAGQFRLYIHGGVVVRAEARLGYLHKGVEALMRGKSPRAASRFAARLSGEAAVAHSIAFARAAEAACEVSPPPRALALRAVMAEAERMASHLADLAALARASGAALVAGPCERHREALLRAAARGFGHRLMMDVVVPGGLATDLAPEGGEALRGAVASLAGDLPGLARLCAGLARRLAGMAVAPPDAVAALAPGGPAGRAGGRDCDLRRAPGYRPYHDLNVPPPQETESDAAARLAVLLTELRESARMLRTLLAELPAGETVAALPQTAGEGFGWAEGPRGDIWTWLRLEGGQIAGAFLRDPGWLHLPLLAAAAAGSDLADWAMLHASFGLSHAGMDL